MWSLSGLDGLAVLSSAESAHIGGPFGTFWPMRRKPLKRGSKPARLHVAPRAQKPDFQAFVEDLRGDGRLRNTRCFAVGVNDFEKVSDVIHAADNIGLETASQRVSTRF